MLQLLSSPDLSNLQHTGWDGSANKLRGSPTFGFSDITCSILYNHHRNGLAEEYCTLQSVMSEKVHCNMPTCVPTCYRDPDICEEMKLARLEFLCPEMGREIKEEWRLTGIVNMELSTKAFVYKKDVGAERPGIEYTSFPDAKAPVKTPSLPVTPNSLPLFQLPWKSSPHLFLRQHPLSLMV